MKHDVKKNNSILTSIIIVLSIFAAISVFVTAAVVVINIMKIDTGIEAQYKDAVETDIPEISNTENDAISEVFNDIDNEVFPEPESSVEVSEITPMRTHTERSCYIKISDETSPDFFDNFSVEEEYLLTPKIPDHESVAELLFLVITNNSGMAATVSGIAKTYDEEGNLIDEQDGKVFIMEPEDTTVLEIFFAEHSSDIKVDTIVYTLSYESNVRKKSLLKDLRVHTEKYDEERILVEVTNVGDEVVKEFTCEAFFLDKNDYLVNVMHGFVLEGVNVRPGETVSDVINAYNDFSKANVYLCTYGEFIDTP